MTHSTSATLASIISSFMGTLNLLVWLLSGVATLLFMYGAVRYIWGSINKESHGADKQVLIWGIIALFVIVSIGGILRFVEIALLGSPVS